MVSFRVRGGPKTSEFLVKESPGCFDVIPLFSLLRLRLQCASSTAPELPDGQRMGASV